MGLRIKLRKACSIPYEKRKLLKEQLKGFSKMFEMQMSRYGKKIFGIERRS